VNSAAHAREALRPPDERGEAVAAPDPASAASPSPVDASHADATAHREGDSAGRGDPASARAAAPAGTAPAANDAKIEAPSRPELRLEQVALLYRGVPLALAANVLIGACVLFALDDIVAAGKLAFWATLLASALIVRTCLYLTTRGTPVDASNVVAREVLFTTGACATGLVWGLSLPILDIAGIVAGDRWFAYTIVIVSGAGIASAGVFPMSYRIVPPRIFIAVVLLPAFVYFATGDVREQVASTLVLVFIAFLYRSSASLHASTRDSMLLKREATEQMELHRLLFQRSPLPMWVYEAGTGRFLLVNDRAVHHYGYARDEFERMRLHDIVAAAPGAGAAQELRRGDLREGRHLKKDGSLIDVVVDSTPMRYGAGTATVAVMQDVTARKRMERELRRLATTDPLTGLANRRHFLTRLENELARLHRGVNPPVSVLMMDLDHFKRVNDRYGHPVGDALLKHCARVVGGAARRMDLVGRMGGEELAVLLPGTDLAMACVFAERVCASLARSPFDHDGTPIRLTASIGVAQMAATDASTSEVLKRADAALYRAKQAGRNRVARQGDG